MHQLLMFLLSQALTSSFMIKFMHHSYMSMFTLAFFMACMLLKSNMFVFLTSSLFTSDVMTMTLIILTYWMTTLSLMASSLTFMNKKNFFMYVYILSVALLMVFLTHNMMTFYIMFELTLLPILLLVMGFGYQPERILAGVSMMMYTMLGSMPLLVFIFMLNNELNSLFMPLLPFYFTTSNIKVVWFLLASLAFMMKLPMYAVHLWLPKTHVEAPLLGSMILASVLLKLGGYGLILISEMFIYSTQALNLWSPVALLGGVVISLLCLTQTDVKSLVAYSSVAHMSLVLASAVSCNKWGTASALIIMLGHGLCSSGLFFLCNLMYENSNSRSFLLNKGSMSFMPSITMWWFLFCIGNMAAPPTLNLVGEIMAFISLMNTNYMFTLTLGLMSFFGAAFSLYLFYFTQHGKGFLFMSVYSPKKEQDLLNLFLHWVPLNILLVSISSISP